MSEKKYIGSGKNAKFGQNIQINLNDLFENLYKDTENKNFVTIFNSLKTELQKSNLDYIAKFKSQDKDKFAVKVSIQNRKEADKFGNDLNISLNEWKAEPKQTEKIETVEEVEIIVEVEDNLPF